MNNINISAPTMGKEEKEAVLAVLDSGQIAQGAVTKKFEERFAAYCGVKFAVATTSGTTALQAALMAHGIGAGDEVITSSFSFIATANTILWTGAKPVFADIDETTFNLDPKLVAAKITPRTKAIMPVHLYGLPCDMAALIALAQKHNLIIVEDAAQAVGAEIDGRKAGSFGTGCFSFYATKNLTTAEGGMITTNDETIAQKLQMIRQHGMRQRYLHEMLGFNFRMTDIQAAIGVAQLDKLETLTAKRIANANFLSKELSMVVRVPIVPPGYRHVFHQYTIRVRGDRDQIVEQLKARGIGTGIYYPIPIHKQPFYLQMGYQDMLPVSEMLAKQVISLPVHPGLSQADLERIVQEVRALCST